MHRLRSARNHHTGNLSAMSITSKRVPRPQAMANPRCAAMLICPAQVASLTSNGLSRACGKERSAPVYFSKWNDLLIRTSKNWLRRGRRRQRTSPHWVGSLNSPAGCTFAEAAPSRRGRSKKRVSLKWCCLRLVFRAQAGPTRLQHEQVTGPDHALVQQWKGVSQKPP